MITEPKIKRVVAFVDGQNLFFAAKEAFGYHYPNYDVRKLVETVCALKGWQLQKIKFYTGIPDASDDNDKNAFWSAKLLVMSRNGIEVFSRRLRYRNKSFKDREGKAHTILVGDEKGIDVRLAIDVMRLAHRREYDVALIFSQDQDYSEVADEMRVISHEQHRWLHIASAYPDSPTRRNNNRGINNTDWIKVDKATYDACIDPRDYRPTTYTGVIIEESLKDKTVLDQVQIVETNVEVVTKEHHTPHLKQWTLHTIQVPEKNADKIADTLSKSLTIEHGHWYADFKNVANHYIVFSGKVFKVDRTNPEQYTPVKEFGVSVGIPAHQLDFAPSSDKK